MTINGTPGNDTLNGGPDNDVLYGLDGDDRLYGNEGNDTLNGDTGADYLLGGPGNDSMAGGAGFDLLSGGAGDDTLDGGADSDSAIYSDATGPITVNLALGTATGAGTGSDTLISVENITGSQYADILTGDTGSNSLNGAGGNDTLTGGAGSDLFFIWNGTADNSVDTITDFTAGLGGDQLSTFGLGSLTNYTFPDNPFASGHARLTQSGANTLVEVDQDGSVGAAGFQTVAILNNVTRSHLVADNLGGFDPNAIGGTTAADSLPGSAGNDEIYGFAGNDTVNGLAGNDRLYGGSGNDMLNGGEGFDTLMGDAGDDALDGGAGSDFLKGGAGDDTLTGGVDIDYFSVWNGSADTSVDTIIDFTAGLGGDQLSTPTTGLTNYTSGDNPFTSGHVRLTQSGANTLFEVDPDGPDGAAGFRTLAILNNVTRSNLVAYNVGSFDPNPILGTATADSLSGGAGNDEINGFAGNDTLNGLAGDDRLYGGADNDLLNGLAGDDRLVGGSGNDTLNGGAGADTLIGGAGNDTLDGGAITDWIGGTDYNLASYGASTAGVTVNLGAGAGIGNGTANDGLGGTDTLININQISGSSYADSITGSSGASVFEQFEGGLGNDTINGGVITDTLNQENNNRVSYQNATGAVSVDLATGTASGAAGNDTLINFSQIRGSAYNDTLFGSDSTLTERFEGLAGNDSIDGRGGFDNVAYDRSTSAVNVNLVTGTASDGFGGTDTLSHIEGIRGSAYNDVLTGGLAANGTSVSDGLSERFIGNAGNDTIDGGQGYDRVDYTTSPTGVNVTLNDTLDGSASDGFGGTDTLRHIEGVVGSAYNDTLTGSDSAAFESFEGRAGNDQINGKGGIDRVDYYSSIAGVIVNLATGTASDGYGGTDTLANIENVRGSRDFNDNLTGNAGNNALDGGAGSDFLNGAAGADTMLGGDGTDAYCVDHAGDLVSESNSSLATGGNDIVYSYVSAYTLTANVERLRLMLAGASNGTGNGLDNTLYAGDGNNVLDGAGGTDTVSYAFASAGVTLNLATAGAQATGGSASDTLISIEHLIGSGFNDSLVGNTANNVLDGGAGSDFLNGGAGSDTMLGGDGTDSYCVDHAGDLVTESNGNLASGGNDIVYSYLAAYTLTANVERLRLMLAGASNGTGNALDNTLYAGDGNNVLDGAGGNDTVSYALATAGVTVSLASVGAQATGGSGSDTLISIENLIGSAFNDSLVGNTANNVLDGSAGSDFLNGATGADTMLGGDGTDSYAVDHAGDLVTESNSSLATGGNDIVYSYLASYTLTANVERLRLMLAGASNGTGNGLDNTLYAGAGNNVLDGAAGNDTVSYAFATAAVTLNLATAGAQATGGSGSDTLISIENLIGSGFNDNLTGNSANNVLDGGAGSDFLNGATGADTMIGGDGTDSYCVDHAGDLVSESNSSLASGGNDIVYSYLASYTLTANVERLRLMLGGASNGTGNGLDNTLYAGDGNNVLDGSGGNDTVSYAFASAGVTVSLATAGAQATGGSAADTLISIEHLIGSSFNDNLTGTTGNNILTGGTGSDVLTGGSGSDTFDFNALSEMGLTNTTWDVITDFAHGTDKLDLATLDADAALAGDQVFTDPVLGGTFSGVFASPGDLYFDTVAHVLYGNTDADTAAEFAIQLVGVATLTAADLFL